LVSLSTATASSEMYTLSLHDALPIYNPGLRVAGTLSPPMGFDRDPLLLEEAVEAVRRASPDVLFVALGAPRQERFIQAQKARLRSEEHTSELQSRENLVCRLLLEKKK